MRTLCDTVIEEHLSIATYLSPSARIVKCIELEAASFTILIKNAGELSFKEAQAVRTVRNYSQFVQPEM